MATEPLELFLRRVTQPIGVFYVGVLAASTLRRNAQPETRKLLDSQENSAGIQRALSDERVKEIRQYLRTADASFPNSIILSLDPARLLDGPDQIKLAGRDIGMVRLVVEQNAESFSVIDGQHRLKGFDDETEKDFDLIVAIFIGLDEEDKAYLFSTINSKQTKVNKSLVYDLFDVAERRSPQRSAHDIAKLLNSDPDSPFYRRIKLLGTNPKFDDEVLYRANLSQGTFVERLLSLITRDAAIDRDVIRRGGELDRMSGDAKLVFRPMWVDDRDNVILKVLFNYFTAVAGAFPKEWNDGTCPLAKTIGFGALVSLLADLVPIGRQKGDLSAAFFSGEVAKIRAGYEKAGPELTFANFPAAGNGETKLLRQLREWLELGAR
jgi:DGQHR domain-containing protein